MVMGATASDGLLNVCVHVTVAVLVNILMKPDALPSPLVSRREQVKPGTLVSTVTRRLSSYLRALLSHVLDCSYT